MDDEGRSELPAGRRHGGRLTRRVERIIADLDDVRLASGFVVASGTPGIYAPGKDDDDGLMAPLWDIATTTGWRERTRRRESDTR